MLDIACEFTFCFSEPLCSHGNTIQSTRWPCHEMVKFEGPTMGWINAADKSRGGIFQYRAESKLNFVTFEICFLPMPFLVIKLNT